MSQTAVVIFGATGDLASKKLFPALAQLMRDKSAYDLHIFALGRRPYDTVTFTAQLPEIAPVLAKRLTYVQMDHTVADGYASLKEQLAAYTNHLFYLAVPPSQYTTILHHIDESHLYRAPESHPGWSRIVVEKPFGTDQASARALDQEICAMFHEENVYRIDHFLGKETVENILAFRFANSFFEPVWHSGCIEQVQITVAESEGVEGRAGYYAGIGAFRDLVQNHILQLVTLLTMDEPATFSLDALSTARNAILKQTSADPSRTIFGQYEGATPDLGETETYAMTTFNIAAPRWQGMPIYVRTGKKLAEKVTDISIQFKKTAQHLFQERGGQEANILTFRIQPDEGIFLSLAVKVPGKRLTVQPARMMFCYSLAFKTPLSDAYVHLFEAVFQGDQTVCLRSDTIEESWRVIDPLLAPETEHRLHQYAPGSWGPEAANEVLQRSGLHWIITEQDVCNGVMV